MILQGEITYWSLLGVKGFISFCTVLVETALNVCVILKFIYRHFRGIKIKIFRGTTPNPPSWLNLMYLRYLYRITKYADVFYPRQPIQYRG